MRCSRHEDGVARHWTVARNLVLGLSLAITCQSVLEQAMYRIRPLGYLGDCTASS